LPHDFFDHSFPALLLVRKLFGFCLLASALFLSQPPCFLLGALSGLGLFHPAALFFGSPLLGLQPPCYLLGLLPSLGLFNSPALFRRNPWLVQRFDIF
jgi:hypothetical protein